MMRRREFTTLIGGSAATWPLVAQAQHGERTRRVGVLMGYPEGDRQAQALRQALENLGWIEGRNIQIDYRWAGADPDNARAASPITKSMWAVIGAEGSVLGTITSGANAINSSSQGRAAASGMAHYNRSISKTADRGTT